MHFNRELCCLTPFKPSERCLRASDAEEQLWHCRVRPHEEFERCLASVRQGLPAGTISRSHPSYEQYVKAQTEKADKELEAVFASTRALKVVGAYMRKHFEGRAGLRGVCHGAKIGKEVRALREHLRSGGASFGGNVEVLGTDISEAASRASGGDVMLLDFHLVYMTWEGHWDFVYSNTLDHAYQPGAALVAWRWTMSGTDGLLVLHRSPFHSSLNIDSTDIYGGSIGDYCSLLRTARFEILDIIRLPEKTGVFHEEDLIFAVRGSADDRVGMETVQVPASGPLSYRDLERAAS